MKVLYVSPVFTDNNQPCKFMIDEKAVKYYAKRDAAVLALRELGGIYAPDTEESRFHHKALMSAKRAIARNGYFCTSVGV